MLTTAQITTLAKLLAACRDDWDLSGVHSFVAQLASDARPWPLLVDQALKQAANVKNLTPKCILEPLSTAAPATVPVVASRPPAHDDPECVVHGGTAKTVHGGYVCCAQAAAETSPRPVSPAPVSRRCGPPPADVKAQIEAMRRESAVNRVRQG